jgi:hypothetical protein
LPENRKSPAFAPGFFFSESIIAHLRAKMFRRDVDLADARSS